MKFTELNDMNGEMLQKQNGRALLDFYAPWCGACKMAAPKIVEALKQTENLPCYKINVDNAPGLAAKYGIMSIPALIITDDGKPVSRKVGVGSVGDVAEFIKDSTENYLIDLSNQPSV